METNPIDQLKKAVVISGGQAALARKIGTKQQHISWWLNKSKRVPAERVLAIESATNGAVTRYDLRPDVFGPAPPAPDLNRRRVTDPRRRATDAHVV